ncbi:MAG: hypothetical protein WCL51_07040 [Bacteroidota bacterium]
MKRISLLIILSLALIKANSQNEVDALRYSQNYYGGTARFTAMGGAFGALGADFSTLSINPAGIGLYKTSEFTFTPTFYVGNTSSTYSGKTNEDNKYNFNLGNIGLVYDFFKRGKFAEGNGWKDVQFGFGINRLNDFNNRVVIQGVSANSSMMNQYVASANNNGKGSTIDELDNFSTYLAYQNYLLNPIAGDSTHYNSPVTGNVNQQKTITTDGSMNEFVITLGGNYSDKIYLGATLGIPFIRYNEQSIYKEINLNDTIHNFNNYSVSDNLTTTGTGVNIKFGMIYRPNNIVRIGLAVHSPTFYSMEDQWSRKIDSDMGDSGKYTSTSPQGLFDYQLQTPWHLIGSLAFFIGDHGLISADYEFVDYTSAKLRSQNDDFFDANQTIQGKYTNTNNFRFGTEWRLNPITLRAGYAFYQSPYKTTINDGKRTILSFGVGFKEKNYFIDFAYSYSKQNEDYYLYNDAALNPVKNTITGSSVMMTVGFKY